jgi:NADPH-dependent ferric siderophore reductase
MEVHFAEIQAGLITISAPLAAIAEQSGFTVKRLNTKTIITAPLGEVTFTGNKNFTKIRFSSSTKSELQLFKELYSDRISKLGLDAEIHWGSTRLSIPMNQTRCDVLSLKKISKNFARLRLRGDFESFQHPSAGLHFRFLFGPKGAEWPSLDQNGLTFWPGGISQWHRPVFTVRRISIDADWIDVDIALHEGGRVTEWLGKVEIGDQIAINGPSGSKMPKAEKMFLFGDETAMPAIMRIIDNVDVNTEIWATIAVRNPEDLQKLPTGSTASVELIEMEDETRLFDTLKDRINLMSGCYLFFAAEKTQVAKVREFIRRSSIPIAVAKLSSYWTRNIL